MFKNWFLSVASSWRYFTNDIFTTTRTTELTPPLWSCPACGVHADVVHVSSSGSEDDNDDDDTAVCAATVVGGGGGFGCLEVVVYHHCDDDDDVLSWLFRDYWAGYNNGVDLYEESVVSLSSSNVRLLHFRPVNIQLSLAFFGRFSWWSNMSYVSFSFLACLLVSRSNNHSWCLRLSLSHSLSLYLSIDS